MEILRKTSANEHDLSTVKDKEGRIKRGKSAIGVWKDPFKEVLNAGGILSQKSTMEDQVLEAEPPKVTAVDPLINEEISREEVLWALSKLRKKAAPGKDSLTAEMINRSCLWELWHTLLNVCWKEGRIPTSGTSAEEEETRSLCDG